MASTRYEKYAILLISRATEHSAYIHITSGQNLARVVDRENRVDKSLDPKTKHGAPNWELTAVVGPMHGVTEFCRAWKGDIAADEISSSETLSEVLQRGIDQAKKHEVTLYLHQ